jgi:hypothetical protein
MIRIKKRYIAIGFLSFLMVALLFFLSPITKNWLVKNSEKLIGRKLEIGELHFNYAKVAIQVKDLVLFEANKTDSFASFSELFVNFDPWSLPLGEYSFSEIRLKHPRIQVIQDGEKFNFTSLIPKKDSISRNDSTTQNKLLKFIVHNIQLIDGKVKYKDLQKNNQVEMNQLNLNLPLIAWNNEQSNIGVDFTMGEKGSVNVKATVDNVYKKYQIDINTKDIDLQPITAYLKDYFDIKSVSGWLTSNLKIIGDMNEIINISLSGVGSVSDFSLIDGHDEEILSSPRLTTSIRDINLKTYHFGFGKIELSEPQLLVIRDKDMTNLERLLLPYFHSDSIQSISNSTSPTKELSVTYKIDTIKIDNGLISIADNTLNRPFKYEINEMNLTMTGLSENADKIPVVFNTKLNNKGELSGKTIWSMTDLMNLELEAKVKKLDLVSFSPYTEFYIASPITQGWFNYDLSLKMEPTKLINQNKLKVDELEFGKRTKDTTAVKEPVRLALYIMKDAKDVIAIDLPVNGNPSNPKFKLGRIVWKTFANLMIKTATSPFKALASLVGTNPETLEKLPFNFAQDSIDKKQRDDLSKLALIMKKKPDLIITLAQTTDPEEEKKQIAVRLAKEDYLSSLPDSLNYDHITATQLKDDNPELMVFIRKTIPTVDSVGINQACLKLIDPVRVESRFQSILSERNRLITDILTVSQGIPLSSVNVTTADLQNLPKELRVPQFKVEVSVK